MISFFPIEGLGGKEWWRGEGSSGRLPPSPEHVPGPGGLTRTGPPVSGPPTPLSHLSRTVGLPPLPVPLTRRAAPPARPSPAPVPRPHRPKTTPTVRRHSASTRVLRFNANGGDGYTDAVGPSPPPIARDAARRRLAFGPNVTPREGGDPGWDSPRPPPPVVTRPPSRVVVAVPGTGESTSSHGRKDRV